MGRVSHTQLIKDFVAGPLVVDGRDEARSAAGLLFATKLLAAK